MIDLKFAIRQLLKHKGSSVLSVISLLGIVGGIACWVPAKRASLLHPMNALRTE